ncbi:MerR family transcriptional regulator [Streptomyces sp. TRM66268-LWL]|uniref:MerR family transcriptional regulator n=1 Tax=Streptomyces polyasparticus TaxID=2767826 RepID=A0ABR7SVW0_9ACTN|nr:MerR family transcriptional regulator [Streptomyces polyasparticus]MBC9719659.1 MerR family transcriptional regulator [Streptomyces polyasparticus]
MLHTPRGGAGSGTATAEGELVSIGQVLNLLREEFPEVTISKIRFLESEGLVEPQRTPSGYRKFSAVDVERLAQVLRMQRDHYLPLKVIREHLDALERGEQAPTAQMGQQRTSDEDLPAGFDLPLDQPAAGRISRATLLAAAQVDAEQLTEWESYGLITPSAEGDYDADAVQIAKLVVELGSSGIEPRHLRAMKASAEREAGLVDQVVAPLRRHRNPQTRTHAEARTKELAALTIKLHAALVQSALRVRLY